MHKMYIRFLLALLVRWCYLSLLLVIQEEYSLMYVSIYIRTTHCFLGYIHSLRL